MSLQYCSAYLQAVQAVPHRQGHGMCSSAALWLLGGSRLPQETPHHTLPATMHACWQGVPLPPQHSTNTCTTVMCRRIRGVLAHVYSGRFL
jgi:hypothetical protein